MTRIEIFQTKNFTFSLFIKNPLNEIHIHYSFYIFPSQAVHFELLDGNNVKPSIL